MKKVVGIRFKKTCKIYYFDPLDIEFAPGDHVIVETARGMEFGTVSIGTREVPEEQIKAPLKPIIRKATPEDEETVNQNQVREREAFLICQRRIQRHGLEMNLVDVDSPLSRRRLRTSSVLIPLWLRSMSPRFRTS